MDETIETLVNEIKALKQRIHELEEHLKKYTAPNRSKKYYQEHKDDVIAKIKANKPSPEKQREYSKRYYEKKKQERDKQTKIQSFEK
jgi:hypothetical protein